MKKITIIIISIIVIALILLIPIPHKLVGEETIEYKAILYSVTRQKHYDSNEHDEFIVKNGTIVKILGFEVFNNIVDEQVGLIVLNRDKSYFKEFSVEDNKVKIKCNLTIENNSDEVIKFYIRAYSKEDVKTGLLKSPNLKIKDQENKEVEFCIKPHNELYDIEVVFEGKFDKNSQKADRDLPDIIRLVIESKEQEKNLTLDNVIELSKKGSNLTFLDFEEYKYTNIGSGLIVEKFDINDDYYLLVGGSSKYPMYVDLVYKGNKEIDIRKEDVENFINNNKS